MSWENVKLIFSREVRDQLRDRRTLFMIAVLPILLYPLLGMSFFQVAQFMRQHTTNVIIVGAESLDELDQLPPLFKKDQFDESLFGKKESAELLKLEFLPASPGQPEGFDWIKATSGQRKEHATELLRSGDYQAVVYFPEDFADRLKDFRARLRSREDASRSEDASRWKVPSPEVFSNTSNEKSKYTEGRVLRVLDRWNIAVGKQNLRVSKVPEITAKPFVITKSDVADKSHKDAALWSKLLPFVLLIWALTGAFYPAIDLCAGEKERGTLETLLSSPAERSEIVWGKLLTIMLFSMATAALNLISMGVTGAFVLSQVSSLGFASAGTQLSLPPASAYLWLGLALIPASALFSALCLALAAFARSTKEGQYYLMPLVLITMPLMILPMAPGIELNLGNSLIPVSGLVLLLRTMLEGNYSLGLTYFVPVAFVTIGCCLLAIRWAVDQFNKESVLFRESERLDLGLWVRHLIRDRQETPTVAAALACFFLILITQFAVNLSGLRPQTLTDYLSLIVFSQFFIIAAPALLMTYLFTSRPRKTLLLEKLPNLLAIPVAILLAVALHPTIHTLGLVVSKLYPINPAIEQEFDKMAKIFHDVGPWLPFVLIALLPAICEELAFRGFILSGLRHVGHKWWAIGLSALFFGMAHGILQQSIMTAIIGLFIGYLAVQTGSLLPCIAFHLTNNSLALLAGYWQFSEEAYKRYPKLEWLVQMEQVVGQEKPDYSFGIPLVLVSAAIVGYLLNWLHRLPYQKTKEEQRTETLDQQSAQVA